MEEDKLQRFTKEKKQLEELRSTFSYHVSLLAGGFNISNPIFDREYRALRVYANQNQGTPKANAVNALLHAVSNGKSHCKSVTNTLLLMAMSIAIKDNSPEAKKLLKKTLTQERLDCRYLFLLSSDASNSVRLQSGLGFAAAAVGLLSSIGLWIIAGMGFSGLVDSTISTLVFFGLSALTSATGFLTMKLLHTANSEVSTQLTAEISSAFELGTEHEKTWEHTSVPTEEATNSDNVFVPGQECKAPLLPNSKKDPQPTPSSCTLF